jgi:hypothetical protein
MVGEDKEGFSIMAPHHANGGMGSTAADRLWGGHLSTMNVLCADGHVKSLRPTRTAAPLDQWCSSMQDNFSVCGTGDTEGINCDEQSSNQSLAIQGVERNHQ